MKTAAALSIFARLGAAVGGTFRRQAGGPFTKLSNTGAHLFEWEMDQLTGELLSRLEEDHLIGTALIRQIAFPKNASELALPRAGTCKVFPGDDDWPSTKTWDAFNEALGGALISTVPIGAVCFNSSDAYDEEGCETLTEVFSSPHTHETDPTSVMFPMFQGLTCMPENGATSDCGLGGFPAYTVNVSTVAQIQMAVNFVRNLNIRLVIKNTGHDYLGKSTGAGSLSVWTHNLKDIEYLAEYDGPGYSGPALKVGAGVTVKEVYDAADEHHVTALGGICESVGFAGGYIAGGGHTPMSGYYGMAADDIMALEVVTASGEFVTATPESSTALYWALRGGGGGTYGVVTSVLIRVHPNVSAVTSMFRFSTSETVTAEDFWQGVRKFMSMFVDFADGHAYSYFWIYPDGDDQFTFEIKPLFAPNYTLESFSALVKPWFDELKELGIDFEPDTQHHDSFLSAYEATFFLDPDLQLVGSAAVRPGNRLFPQSAWEDEETFEAIFAHARKLAETGHRWGGYSQAPRNRADVDNAVSPAWRHVVAFLISATLQPALPTTKEAEEASRALSEDVLGPWRDLAPAGDFGGSYLNEADVMEPNWQDDFYGAENYVKLQGIKSNWDPSGVFYATRGVGSEEWEVRDGDVGVQTQNGRLCRV